MPPTPDDPLQSPQESDSEPGISVHKRHQVKSPLGSISRLPYRRSNASLSNLFASTTSLPTLPNPESPSRSGTVTPKAGSINGSVFSPTGSTVRSPSLDSSTRVNSNETRDVILRAFSPHVSVLASQDTEELIRHKGVNGGLVELLRPFGESIQGKVTIRDSSGVSRSWDDFSVRFAGVKDGLESPDFADRKRADSAGDQKRNSQRRSLLEYKPARLRSGGDVAQIEDLVERHLTFAEEQSGPVDITSQTAPSYDANGVSPFYMLYLRRMLSGLPMVPSETFSHPVAAVIAISSRSASPIEELRNLYDSSNTGEHRLPQWVHNEFLRYYVLIHDEDYDDITKSMTLYDQMKRHFGLHCHLLRLRSTQCVSSDDENIKLPTCEWVSAGEELAEIMRREANEDDEDPTPWIFESDAAALKAFVREMVTQSIIPSMERASATWNDQVASRRRGFSGRFMSLSKRFTSFGSRNASGSALGAGGSNYDSLQGFYRPDAPEALMRKLADYAMMLRDFKLAQGIYDMLCQDFKSDKSWRHYAAANEMAAISALLTTSGLSSKVRLETIDQYLETAYYSYVTRAAAPYNALRTLILAAELLKLRSGSALDVAARWSSKLLDDRLVGVVGHVLLMERIAACYGGERKPSATQIVIAERRRKAAFWNMLATDAWLRLEKASQAEKCLLEAMRLYRLNENKRIFADMANFLFTLREAVHANRSGPHHIDGEDLLDENQRVHVETLQAAVGDHHQLDFRSPAGTHRRSLSLAVATAPPPILTPFSLPTVFDPLGAMPSGYQDSKEGNDSALAPPPPAPPPRSPVLEKKNPRDEGFE